MQNNTTKIIAAVIAILAIGGIATLAMSGNKSTEKVVNNIMSKTSEVIKKTDEKMAMDKIKAEEAIMKKDTMSKSSDSMMKIDSKSSSSPEEKKAMETNPNQKTMDDKMMKEEDTMSKEMMNKSAEVSSPTGMYSQYSVTNLAQNSTGTNVIFFHAPWCPSCKSIDADITANLDKLPEGFQILKADFDTSTALKQKYGVTQQSTFVKVDKDGNKIGTASAQFGLKKVADIVAFSSK